MGISRQLHTKYTENKMKYFSPDMKFLELGDQEIIYGVNSGKRMREVEGVFYKEWTTIDLHRVHGVVLKDLSIMNQDLEYGNYWDVISNFGTSEHVEPEEGHYNCWCNIHRWTKIGGYSIHEVPEFRSWPNHCRFYYDLDFFLSFKKIGYEILDLCTIDYEKNGNLVFCIMKKVEEIDFFDYDEFGKMIKIDEEVRSTMICSLNNPKGIEF